MNAKKIMLGLLIVGFMVLIPVLPVWALQASQDEHVQVVNTELILRVLQQGSPVAGLRKSDFVLSEDGEPCAINGFFEIRRRLAPGDGAEEQFQQPRLHLLLFWVGNPDADVEGVLKKFFSGIYRAGDRVILSTPAKTYELPSPGDIAGLSAVFLEQWRREAKEKQAGTLRFHGELNRRLEDLVRRILEKEKKREKEEAAGEETSASFGPDTESQREVESFVAQYARMVDEYRLHELSPDMSAFEAMARSLISARSDKFALVFFQHDSLPLYDAASVKNLCQTRSIPEEICDKLTNGMVGIEEKAKSASKGRLVSEELKSLFIQANIQFHLLALSSFKSAGRDNASSFFSLTKSEELFSDWDRIMQEISRNSGGLRMDGDRMTDALDKVGAFEDVYYHITYVPREQGAKKRKIDVRVLRPGMQVVHGRTLEVSAAPQVKIAALSASAQFLRLQVADFYAIAKNGVPTGFVNIEVTGKPAENEPALPLLSWAGETSGAVELPLALPRPGNWYLEVRLSDQITGRQDAKLARVEMAAAAPAPAAERDPDRVLAVLLKRAAAYAEKLKKAAFHFICRESVSETAFSPERGIELMFAVKPTSWTYDYQIVARNGKIVESRVLLEKNGEKLRQPKAQLETVFQSFFSFYMPVTLLAREKQRLYNYRLLGREEINRKSVWHVAADRRGPRSIPWGEIWIGEEDGMVLKIQADQASIVGFEKLAQKAVDQGLLPEIVTIHEYELEKSGMCFPSKTTFIERYKPYGAPLKKMEAGPGPETLGLDPDRSRTYFKYSDYLFFSVSTRSEEKPE